MRKLIFLIGLMPFIVKAQTQEISFELGKSWEEIQRKATAENKYIFVDCYATWCVPCKVMDKKVFNNDTVANHMSDKFVSVKIQMDSTKSDDENVKLLYSVARKFEKRYSINALPTYLVFDPHGNAIHKDAGLKTVKEFISLLNLATDSSKGLYTLVDNALSGKLEYGDMAKLASKLKGLKEDSLSWAVAKKYMQEYLDQLPDSQFLKRENIWFLRAFSRNIRYEDRIFGYYYNYPLKIDSAMNEKGYSKSLVNFIISNLEIQPHINDAWSNPNNLDWKQIKKTIKRKYDASYATYNVLNAQITWYKARKDWNRYIEVLIKKWKLYKEEFNNYSSLGINDLAWSVCVHSNNKRELRIALIWTEMAIANAKKPEVPILDTKANILYKMGERQMAIEIERQVVDLAEKTSDNTEYGKKVVAHFKAILEKMINGQSIELK